MSSTAGLTGLLTNQVPVGVAVARVLDNGTTADVLIRALEKRGVARRLAEPNLTALSGDTASFLAGGEFPFPVQADNNKITIEFKKFGIGLAFTPTVLGEGLINLKIEPEVSELDPTSSLQVNGISVPGLMVRRTQTTLELRDGQSFAIAGLLYTNHYKNASQLPWIGEVPVLGTLFRSAAFQRKETDLVIIVTPRLVRPARPGQRLATPHDRRLPSNDPEFFLGGQLEVSAARPEPDRGHILDLAFASGNGGTHDPSTHAAEPGRGRWPPPPAAWQRPPAAATSRTSTAIPRSRGARRRRREPGDPHHRPVVARQPHRIDMTQARRARHRRHETNTSAKPKGLTSADLSIEIGEKK
jgi:Flp pilus assembly secretin CpaC